AKDELIEYASYVGNYYGTPKSYVMDKLASGENVILEIEMQGALKVKEKFPDCVTIFLTPETYAELDRRLHKRGTETEEVIQNRLNRAKEEISFMDKYDYVVINGDLDTCVNNVNMIIQAEAFKVVNSASIIENIKNTFK
nr:guanylate kinase [Lachnospiraceae bacterium]